jgi:hypothetical protein
MAALDHQSSSSSSSSSSLTAICESLRRNRPFTELFDWNQQKTIVHHSIVECHNVSDVSLYHQLFTDDEMTELMRRTPDVILHLPKERIITQNMRQAALETDPFLIGCIGSSTPDDEKRCAVRRIAALPYMGTLPDHLRCPDFDVRLVLGTPTEDPVIADIVVHTPQFVSWMFAVLHPSMWTTERLRIAIQTCYGRLKFPDSVVFEQEVYDWFFEMIFHPINNGQYENNRSLRLQEIPVCRRTRMMMTKLLDQKMYGCATWLFSHLITGEEWHQLFYARHCSLGEIPPEHQTREMCRAAIQRYTSALSECHILDKEMVLEAYNTIPQKERSDRFWFVHNCSADQQNKMYEVCPEVFERFVSRDIAKVKKTRFM